MDFKCADAVHLVAEEIDAERVLRAVGKDVENAATNGILTRFVDVIHELEAQFVELFPHQLDVLQVADMQGLRAFVEHFLRDDQLAQGFRMRHDEEERGRRRLRVRCSGYGRGAERGQPTEHLGAQNLVGSVALTVFHRPPEAGRQEKHLLGAQHLRQVVIEIACLFGVVQHEKHRTGCLVGH